MGLNFWLAQVSSAVAIVIVVISFQIKNKNILLIMNAAANAFICVALLLSDAYLGAAATAVAIVRGFAFFKLELRPVWYRYSALIFIYILLGISAYYTYEDNYSILMIIATVLLIFGLWQKNIIFIRFISIFASCIFIPYNIWHAAYVMVALESLIIVSCIIFLIRIFIERKNNNKTLDKVPPV